MPASIIVGGQYGSEGKGKVSLEVARLHGSEIIAMRVGGPNSGHIAYDRSGKKWVFRQIPVCSVDGASLIVIPHGSYLDVKQLLKEAGQVGIGPDKLKIDPRAKIITKKHIEWESSSGLTHGIGSTGSGTGAAVLSSILPGVDGLPNRLASDEAALRPYLAETLPLLRRSLEQGKRLIVEGTQGFGLSLSHGPWPKVTSRDTTAAAVISECGLSPFDVDEITLVIRAHPIRVAGASGPLEQETDWESLAKEAGAAGDITERTTVTNKIRRVGKFDAELVCKAIAVNNPTRIVLNHLDYIDWTIRNRQLSTRSREFIQEIENQIGRKIDWVGINEHEFINLNKKNHTS